MKVGPVSSPAALSQSEPRGGGAVASSGLLLTSDVLASTAALRRFVAFEVAVSSSRNQPSDSRRRFYELFPKLLDRIFGEEECDQIHSNSNRNKALKGGWMANSSGLPNPQTGLTISMSSLTSPRNKRSTAAFPKHPVGKNSTKHTMNNMKDFQLDLKKDAMTAALKSVGKEAYSLIQLLSAFEEEEGSIFHLLFSHVMNPLSPSDSNLMNRMTYHHPVEYRLDLRFLPQPTQFYLQTQNLSVIPRLYTQLLARPLLKQQIDPRHPSLLVSITEYYLFYFLRYPTTTGAQPLLTLPKLNRTSSMSKNRNNRHRSASNCSDFNVGSTCTFFKLGIGALLRANPYNILLLQYLKVFLPYYCNLSKLSFPMLSNRQPQQQQHPYCPTNAISPHSEFFIHLLIELWLHQNALTTFGNDTKSAQVSSTAQEYHQPLSGNTSLNNAVSSSSLSKKDIVSSSEFLNVHTMGEYLSPSDDLLASLHLVVVYLLADPVFPLPLPDSSWSANFLQNNPINDSMKNSSRVFEQNICMNAGGGLLQKPLFDFFRVVVAKVQIGSTSLTVFHGLLNIWLAVLQPWKCAKWGYEKKVVKSPRQQQRRSSFSFLNNQDEDEKEEDDDNACYTPEWQSYVLANYHFYTTLFGAILSRLQELEFYTSTVNPNDSTNCFSFKKEHKQNIELLVQILNVYNEDLCDLLCRISRTLSTRSTNASPTTNLTSTTSNEVLPPPPNKLLSNRCLSVVLQHCAHFNQPARPVSFDCCFHSEAQMLHDTIRYVVPFSCPDSNTSVEKNDGEDKKHASTRRPSAKDIFLQNVSEVFSSHRKSSQGKNNGNNSRRNQSNFYEKEAWKDQLNTCAVKLQKIFNLSMTTSPHDKTFLPSHRFNTKSNVQAAPARDTLFPFLLTKKGIKQIVGGLRLFSPICTLNSERSNTNKEEEWVTYFGDPMLRPICSYEISWLVRILYHASVSLNRFFGLDQNNPYLKNPTIQLDKRLELEQHKIRYYEQEKRKVKQFNQYPTNPTIRFILIQYNLWKLKMKQFRFNLRFMANRKNLVLALILIIFVYILL